MIQLYVQESFLRRLVLSRYGRSIVLKGGMLLAAFDLRRATRDVDVLALRADNDPAAIQRLIMDVVSEVVDDGVEFLQSTITAAAIRNEDVYSGVRASLEARLASARIKFSVDVSVGDPVFPEPTWTSIPLILGGEPIEVLAYPKGMVVAEKLVTAMQWGRSNTRWRDFADLFLLVQGELAEAETIEALQAVSRHRSIRLRPLSEVFDGMSMDAQVRWATWLRRQGEHARVPEDFAIVLETIEARSRSWFLKAIE